MHGPQRIHGQQQRTRFCALLTPDRQFPGLERRRGIFDLPPVHRAAKPRCLVRLSVCKVILSQRPDSSRGERRNRTREPEAGSLDGCSPEAFRSVLCKLTDSVKKVFHHLNDVESCGTEPAESNYTNLEPNLTHPGTNRAPPPHESFPITKPRRTYDHKMNIPAEGRLTSFSSIPVRLGIPRRAGSGNLCFLNLIKTGFVFAPLQTKYMHDRSRREREASTLGERVKTNKI